MATLAVTSSPQAVSILGGTPVQLSAACTFGITSAGAASGPSIATGVFTWPGNPGETVTLFVQTATTANLNYLS